MPYQSIKYTPHEVSQYALDRILNGSIKHFEKPVTNKRKKFGFFGSIISFIWSVIVVIPMYGVWVSFVLAINEIDGVLWDEYHTFGSMSALMIVMMVLSAFSFAVADDRELNGKSTVLGGWLEKSSVMIFLLITFLIYACGYIVIPVLIVFILIGGPDLLLHLFTLFDLIAISVYVFVIMRMLNSQ